MRPGQGWADPWTRHLRLRRSRRGRRRSTPWWSALACAVRRGPQALHFTVAGGEVASTGPWLYAWVHRPSGLVVHAGTTVLDPRVRAWVHLVDADPSRGRIAALLRSQDHLEPDDAFEVSAVRLPDGAPRPAAKRALLGALLAGGLLSEDLAQRTAAEAGVRSSSSSSEPLGAGSRRSVDVLVREVQRSRRS